jgi:hypothetical protein
MNDRVVLDISVSNIAVKQHIYLGIEMYPYLEPHLLLTVPILYMYVATVI